MIDLVDHKYDFKLWSQLLQFRRRIHGIDGVLSIWRGLAERKIALPSSGRWASVLWQGFIDAAVCNEELLGELIAYCKANSGNPGTIWHLFYETIIIAFLKKDPPRAYELHRQLKNWCPLLPNRLARTIRATPSNKGTLTVLRKIYQESAVRNLYSVVVPLLCSRRKYAAAYDWHKCLIDHGDLPTSTTDVQPLLHHLPRIGDPAQLGRVTQDLQAAGVRFQESTKPVITIQSLTSRETMNRFLGEVFSVSEKPLNDSFCARLFATKAFPVEVILRGMRMLGAIAIGPLSMRELAVREGSPENILRRIEEMGTLRLSIGSSKFSRLIRQFAMDNEQELLHDLLTSDQHPDVVEDRTLQEAFLGSYLATDNVRQVRKTLVVLTAFTRHPKALEYNLLLRSHLARRNVPAIKQVFHEMTNRDIRISDHSSRNLVQKFLRTRNRSKRPVSRPYRLDELNLTTRMLLSTLQSGGTLNPEVWREIFRRFGMTRRLDDLERLALWLASFYSSRAENAARLKYAPSRVVVAKTSYSAALQDIPEETLTRNPAHPLRILFPPAFQKAIVEWSFVGAWRRPNRDEYTLLDVSRGDKRALETRPWIRGLRLIKMLADKGVYVQMSAIWKAFLHRLICLYGGGRTSRIRTRLLRKHNRVPLSTMVREAEQMWNVTLSDQNGQWLGLGRPRKGSVSVRYHAPRRDTSPEEGVTERYQLESGMGG